VIGRTYHRKYGYPWRWAIPAEIAWRIEHLPRWVSYEGRPLAPLARRGYVWRKSCERRGHAHHQHFWVPDLLHLAEGQTGNRNTGRYYCTRCQAVAMAGDMP
jgi:hypothetical protein